MNEKVATVFTTWIGRYVTKVYMPFKGDVWQNDGLELDEEGEEFIKDLENKGYEIFFD